MKALNWPPKLCTLFSKCLETCPGWRLVNGIHQAVPGSTDLFSYVSSWTHLKDSGGYRHTLSPVDRGGVSSEGYWRGYFWENRRWHQRTYGGKHRKCCSAAFQRHSRRQADYKRKPDTYQHLWGFGAQLEESPRKVLKTNLNQPNEYIWGWDLTLIFVKKYHP